MYISQRGSKTRPAFRATGCSAGGRRFGGPSLVGGLALFTLCRPPQSSNSSKRCRTCWSAVHRSSLEARTGPAPCKPASSAGTSKRGANPPCGPFRRSRQGASRTNRLEIFLPWIVFFCQRPPPRPSQSGPPEGSSPLPRLLESLAAPSAPRPYRHSPLHRLNSHRGPEQSPHLRDQ